MKGKVSKRVSRTVLKLSIAITGKNIEEFAGEIRIGADSWRRIGILTFSGDVKRNPKLTYKRIQTHFEKKYEVQFGYGTIIQLVVSRSKAIFGAIKTVCERARKVLEATDERPSHLEVQLCELKGASNIANYLQC